MSEQPQHTEIDLIDVVGKGFSSIGRGLQALGKWCGKRIIGFCNLTLKHWWILLIVSGLGATIGYFRTNFQETYFETEMLVEAHTVPRMLIADRINSLQKIVNDRNYAVLSKNLDVSEDDVRGIIMVSASIVNTKREEDIEKITFKTDENGDKIEVHEKLLGPPFIRINVRTKENRHIEALSHGILHFVENDIYISEQVSLAREHNLRQQEAIEYEIQQLTLFQQKSINRQAQTFTPNATAPLMFVSEDKTYTKEILDLRNRLSVLKMEIEELRPLAIVQPFIPFENPVDQRFTNVFLYGILFFAASFAVLWIRKQTKN